MLWMENLRKDEAEEKDFTQCWICRWKHTKHLLNFLLYCCQNEGFIAEQLIWFKCVPVKINQAPNINLNSHILFQADHLEILRLFKFPKPDLSEPCEAQEEGTPCLLIPAPPGQIFKNNRNQTLQMGEYIGTIYWTMLEPKTPSEEEKWNLKLAGNHKIA